jgi:putative ABC transport system permease protein
VNPVIRPATAAARWGLRAYAASTVLIVVAGALAVAGILPVLSLGGSRAGRLALRAVPEADLGISWLDRSATAATLQRQGIETVGGILFGLALSALVVAILTVLALAVTRASSRRGEMVVRRSVGASRGQVRAAGLIEGVVMALGVVVVAVPVGLACAGWALASWPGRVTGGAGAIPPAAVAVLGAVIVAGALLSTLVIARTPRPVAGGASRLGLAVPTLQLAVSFAMLLAAGQLTRRAAGLLERVRRAEVSGSSGGGEIFQLDLPRPVAERRARYASLLGRLRAGHPYDVVSLSSAGALVGLGSVDEVITDCGQCSLGGVWTPLRAVPATIHAVSPDTFRAIGVRAVAGRSLTGGDRWGAPPAVVINRTLAEKQFERQGAVGRKIRLGQGERAGWYTVVGVVENRTVPGFGADFTPPYTVYLSALQFPPSAAELLVRPAGAAIGPDAEAAIGRILATSGTVVRRVSEPALLSAESAPVRWFARLVAVVGAVVLAIAVLGTLAVMQLWVTALAPELALRRAVGARRRQIFSYVLVRAVGVGVAGVALGMLVSELSSDPLAGLIGGLPLWELALVPRPAMVLLLATLAGALIPAWRAARADPARLAATLE